MRTSTCCVIPNWNGQGFVAEAVESLLAQSHKTTIVVVDNGSVDGSVEMLREQFPAVEVIELPKNRGFAGGVNVGINFAIDHGAEFVALFNNDAVADKEWLENLVAAAKKHPEAGIVTGKLLRSDKKHFDSTGDFYSTYGLPFPRGRNESDKGQYDTGEEVFAGSGGASLFRVDMLQQIGLFDERFFAYFEDDDIGFRAQLAGWKVWYEPQAVAYHKVGGTSSKLGSFARYHSIKNFVMCYFKNMPGWIFWKYLPLFVAQLARMFVGSLRDKQIGAFLHGLLKAVIYLPATLRKRRNIQRQRTVSVEYIDSILHHGRPPRPPKLKGAH